MKRITPVVLALLLLAYCAWAAGHSAIVSWTAPSDATSSSVYNVYRLSATCPASGIGSGTWTKLTATPIPALTYTDSTITAGAWCYYVTQLQGSVESAPSNTAGGSITPSSPSITIVIQ